jgi:hypothetical protein
MRREAPIKPRVAQKARVKGRNAHHRRGAGQGGQHRVQVELGQKDHRGAAYQRDIRRHKQPMRVKDRQRMQQHVIDRKGPGLGQHLRVRQQVAVGQHSPFRAARGARGVKKGRQVVLGAGNGREAAGLALSGRSKRLRSGRQRHQRRAMALGDRGKGRLG